jgi:hypothetical protein
MFQNTFSDNSVSNNTLPPTGHIYLRDNAFDLYSFVSGSNLGWR